MKDSTQYTGLVKRYRAVISCCLLAMIMHVFSTEFATASTQTSARVSADAVHAITPTSKLASSSLTNTDVSSFWVQAHTLSIGAVCTFGVFVAAVLTLLWQGRRKTATEALLAASEERFRTMIESAPEAILVLDTDKRKVIDANCNAERLFGRSREQLYQLELEGFYGTTSKKQPELSLSIQQNCQRVLAGDNLIFERMIIRSDGTQIPCEVWAVKLPSKQGNLIRLSYIDISEQKKSKKMLQDYHVQLELQVMERTNALHDALGQAQKATRAKSIFLSRMSHEIRTPMNAILGYAQLMQRMPDLPPQMENYIETISHSGDQLLNLINHVLEMSKLETGRVETYLEDFNLHNLLIDIEKTLATQATKKSLSLTLHIDQNLPVMVRTDQIKLRQILLNTIGNAIKFTNYGGITITANLLGHKDGQFILAISITDSGIGIASEDYDKVFDAFEQAAPTNTSSGIGLGMAISRQYARLLGGDLRFESEVSAGTSVHLTFTAQRCELSSVAPTPSLVKVRALTANSPQPKILIVDRLTSDRALLRLMLEGVGMRQIRELNDAGAAVLIAGEWIPDLILIERDISGMRGLDTSHQIKSLPQCQHTQILIVMRSNSPEELHDAWINCADGSIAKPFRTAEILEEIHRVLPDLNYLYQEEEARQILMPDSQQFRTDILQLEEKLTSTLREMIECGDVLRFEKSIAAQLSQQYPALQKHLQLLAERFEYARILEILDYSS